MSAHRRAVRRLRLLWPDWMFDPWPPDPETMRAWARRLGGAVHDELIAESEAREALDRADLVVRGEP